jgi:hypothetical protein
MTALRNVVHLEGTRNSNDREAASRGNPGRIPEVVINVEVLP